MNKKGNLVKRITRSMLTLVWLVGIVSPFHAFGRTQQTGSSGATQSAVPAGKPADAGATPAAPSKNANGIKVHGHWMIEVRNPDGTLVTHREFENALVAPTGAVTLSQVLTGADLVGGWAVDLMSSATNTALFPCFATQPTGAQRTGPCRVISPGFQDLNIHDFPTLSVAAISGGGLMLSGTATADLSASIDTVSSYVINCPPPSPCANTTPGRTLGNFTSAVVSPAISVTVGQSIAVTVTITFS